MPYKRGDLYLISEFDFTVTEPGRKDSIPQDKFLIVLDVVNDDMGIFCLTTSLSGHNSSKIRSTMTKNCEPVGYGHFYKFHTLQAAGTFTFRSDTFVRAIPSDVFETSIATLYQRFNMDKKADRKCQIEPGLFVSIVSCLSASGFLDGELKKRLEEIAQEVATEIEDRKLQQVLASEAAANAKIEQEKADKKKASGKK